MFPNSIIVIILSCLACVTPFLMPFPPNPFLRRFRPGVMCAENFSLSCPQLTAPDLCSTGNYTVYHCGLGMPAQMTGSYKERQFYSHSEGTSKRSWEMELKCRTSEFDPDESS